MSYIDELRDDMRRKSEKRLKIDESIERVVSLYLANEKTAAEIEVLDEFSSLLCERPTEAAKQTNYFFSAICGGFGAAVIFFISFFSVKYGTVDLKDSVVENVVSENSGGGIASLPQIVVGFCRKNPSEIFEDSSTVFGIDDDRVLFLNKPFQQLQVGWFEGGNFAGNFPAFIIFDEREVNSFCPEVGEGTDATGQPPDDDGQYKNPNFHNLNKANKSGMSGNQNITEYDDKSAT